MNFLNFLTSGQSLFNCKIQNTVTTSKIQPVYQIIPHNDINQKQSKKDQQEKLQVEKKQEKSLQLNLNTSLNQLNVDALLPQLLLTQQQHLINQYMHLNLQLMSQKIKALESQNCQKQEDNQQSQIFKNMKKKMYISIYYFDSKKLNICGHDDKQHYAKGMCSNCYHKYGRTKKPWNCPHQKLYASGMCQNCYINRYNKKKRQLLHSHSQEKNNFDLNQQNHQQNQSIKNQEQDLNEVKQEDKNQQ